MKDIKASTSLSEKIRNDVILFAYSANLNDYVSEWIHYFIIMKVV